LVSELHSWVVKQTKGFGQVTRSNVFLANYENTGSRMSKPVAPPLS
jgi:hypothetical protein